MYFVGKNLLFYRKNLIGNRLVDLKFRPKNFRSFYAVIKNPKRARLDKTRVFVPFEIIVKPLMKTDWRFEKSGADVESFLVNAENRFGLFWVNYFDEIAEMTVNFVVGQADNLEIFVLDKAKNRKAEIVSPTQ